MVLHLSRWNFFRRNGIRSVTSAPYHPATNGQAKRMVAEAKTALMRDQEGTLECRLARFLHKQHTTVHATTGRTPAAAMFGRELPSVLTYLKAKKSRETAVDHKRSRVSKLTAGQPVLLRNFLGLRKWIRGTLVRKLGGLSWVVDTASGFVRRHVDHIRAIKVSGTQNSDQVSPSTAWSLPTNPQASMTEAPSTPAGDTSVATKNRNSSRSSRNRRPPAWWKDYCRNQ